MSVRLRWLLVILVGVTTALAACSDDGGGGTGDTGPDLQRDTGDDVDPDATPDATPDGDAGTDGSDMPVFVPTETEPNDFDNPNDITLPATILGQINEPDFDPDFGSTPDLDAFRFTADAGTVVRLTVGPNNIEPYLVVVTEDESAETQIFKVLSPSTPGLTRQLFIPVTGSYVLVVQDYRNDGENEPVGGDEYTYEVSVTTETVAPETVSLPLTHTGETIPTGNGLRIFEFSVDEAGLFLANTDAFDTGTNLDTALVVMNDDLTELVAENDDEDPGAGLYDSLLRFPIDAGSYNLVLDHYETNGEDTTYDMTVRVADPAVEEEPTSGPDSAWPLPVAAADGDPLVVTGTIEAPEASEEGDIPDYDWFDLGELAAGDTVVINVSAPEGSAAVPQLYAGTVFDSFFGPELFVTRTMADADGAVRFEMTAVFDGPHFAIVSDVNNFAPDDAPEDFELDPVGGATYTYEITAQAFTRTESALAATPISAAGETLDPNGAVAWYTFSPASDGLLLVSVKNANFEPTLWLLDRTDEEGGEPLEIGTLYELGDQFLLTEGVTDAQLQLAVFNEGAWPADATATFDLGIEIVEQEVGQESEVDGADFPDTTETALGLPATGGAYEGALDGASAEEADHDVFSIELTAGSRLFAETYGPLAEDAEEPGNADTILTLEGPGLDEPIESDDFTGLFSRIQYDVPEDGAGTYTLTVMPYCGSTECDGGAFGIRVLVLGASD